MVVCYQHQKVNSIGKQMPYNVERLLSFLTGGDSERVKAWMTEFYATGQTVLSNEEAARLREQFDMCTQRTTDAEVAQTIKARTFGGLLWACV
eukprot:m.341936 g.341936  ORF g.341936 m.341936 type:complete len:93 (-) comp19836_c1_seq3:326-604(-)